MTVVSGTSRGVALALGDAGVTVYAGGRSTRANATTDGRREAIEETVERGFSRGWKLCELPTTALSDAGRYALNCALMF